MRFELLRLIRAFSVGVGFVTALSACGDDTKSTPITIAGLPLAYGEAFCAQMIKCSEAGTDASFFVAMAKAEPAACAAAAARIVPDSFTDNVNSGKITVDGAKLAQCFDLIATTCDSNPDTLPVCREALKGNVPADGACDEDTVCAGDSYCMQDDDDCPGVCKPRVATGGDCTDYSACSQLAGPAECNWDTMKCQARAAAVTVAAGADCGWMQVGDDYVEHKCAPGLACGWAEEATESETCLPIIPEGSGCEGVGVCAVGTFCTDLGDGLKCVAPPFVTMAGAACNEGFGEEGGEGTLAVCNRLLGIYCGENGKCATTDGNNGSYCNDDDLLPCKSGFYCDDDSSTCKSLIADNGDCGWSGECASGFCSNDGKCSALVCE